VGEVLEVTPSSRAGTLAMVTIRRLILPEHTAAGRTSLYKNTSHGFFEAFNDYDATLLGNWKKANGEEHDAKNGHAPNDDSENLASVVFRVPIEELVIVSHQTERSFGNEKCKDSSGQDALHIGSSYSWLANCQIPLKLVARKKVGSEPRVPWPLSAKKLEKLSLCHRCRTWLPKSQITICENENCPTTRHLMSSVGTAPEGERIYIGWCNICVDTVKRFNTPFGNRDSNGLLPCCSSTCDCRQCHASVDRHQASQCFTTLAAKAHLSKTLQSISSTDVGSSSLDNADDAFFLDTAMVLDALPVCKFDLSPGVLDLDNLAYYSSKPITKVKPIAKTRGRSSSMSAIKPSSQKRKGDLSPGRKYVKKPKIAAARPSSPVPFASGRGALRKEDYSVFKPTCCRLLAYRDAFAAMAPRSDGAGDVEGQSLTGDGPHGPERLRNHRELQEKNCKLLTVEKDEKTLTGRAARANQRRLVKDVAFLGGTSFSLDSLAGRESQLRFDQSNIHAWGVFADGEISAGDVIAEYRGELIGNAMAEKREREYELAKIGSDYMFRVDGLNVCDATKQGNVARFINASCDPNCYTKIITLDGKQRIVIYAKRDIKVGEELSYDYKFSLEYDELKRIPCHCGAQDCRGYMNWVSCPQMGFFKEIFKKLSDVSHFVLFCRTRSWANTSCTTRNLIASPS
jgi:SET domain